MPATLNFKTRSKEIAAVYAKGQTGIRKPITSCPKPVDGSLPFAAHRDKITTQWAKSRRVSLGVIDFRADLVVRHSDKLVDSDFLGV